jgi:chromate transport protein ChrA
MTPVRLFALVGATMFLLGAGVACGKGRGMSAIAKYFVAFPVFLAWHFFSAGRIIAEEFAGWLSDRAKS